jgi:hypothetical protein
VPVLAFAILALVAYAGQSIAQRSSSSAADCRTYARNQAEMQGSRGGGALGGGLGVIGGGVRAGREREANYQYYYDSCMRGAR